MYLHDRIRRQAEMLEILQSLFVPWEMDKHVLFGPFNLLQFKIDRVQKIEIL